MLRSGFNERGGFKLKVHLQITNDSKEINVCLSLLKLVSCHFNHHYFRSFKICLKINVWRQYVKYCFSISYTVCSFFLDNSFFLSMRIGKQYTWSDLEADNRTHKSQKHKYSIFQKHWFILPTCMVSSSVCRRPLNIYVLWFMCSINSFRYTASLSSSL